MGCDGSFIPSAATNQQNSVRDVVQLSQNQIIAISEAIQQADTTIRLVGHFFE